MKAIPEKALAYQEAGHAPLKPGYGDMGDQPVRKKKATPKRGKKINPKKLARRR